MTFYRTALAFAAFVFLAAPLTRAQSLDFYGFVKTAVYYDTRQGEVVRDGDVYLFPLRDPDADNDEDAVDTANLLFFPFLTRAGVRFTDIPEAFGAQIEARIEADFYGPGNATLNTFRLRRSTVTMMWGARELLVGMEWSPLTTNAAPRTVGTDVGRPFQTFARQPQVRLTLRPDSFRIVGALSQQVDAFSDQGGGSRQQHRAGIPAATLLAEVVGESLRLGAAAHVKTVRPLRGEERYTAGHGQVYAELTQPAFSARAKVIYGESASDFVMPGGYITATHTETGAPSFHPTGIVSGWIDAETSGTTSYGISAGYFQQLGTSETFGRENGSLRFANDDGVRALDLADQWRIAPRVNVTSGPMRVGFEVEVTSALYTLNFDESFRPDPTDDDERVVNVRGNVALFYFF